MDRTLELLRLLADGRLHSGAVLAERLDMTRAAVCKAVRRLSDQLGLEITSGRGRGYRLITPIELLDAQRIGETLAATGRAPPVRLEIHQRIDSTNRHLMREAAHGAPSGTVCLAERQTAGQGRHGRCWVSPFGANLYLSILWRYPCGPAGLSGLSLAAGAVVADALRQLGVQGLVLKWPNDLLWGGRKLGGILLEVSGEAQGPCVLVLGLGLNLRMSRAQAQAIDQPWVDLSEALGAEPVGRNRLAAILIGVLCDALEHFAQVGLAHYRPLWDTFDALRGEPVILLLGEQRIRGIMQGIAPDGALCLATPEGERMFHSGEVSLRSETM